MAAMKKEVRNFDVPLPKETYERLRSEAELSEEPTTVLVRRVIELWLEKRERERRHEAIAGDAVLALMERAPAQRRP